MFTKADVKREIALDSIMQWDYEATGDFAPWDYDDTAAKCGTAREDIEAFVIETGRTGAAKDTPKAFNDAFLGWFLSE